MKICNDHKEKGHIRFIEEINDGVKGKFLEQQVMHQKHTDVIWFLVTRHTSRCDGCRYRKPLLLLVLERLQGLYSQKIMLCEVYILRQQYSHLKISNFVLALMRINVQSRAGFWKECEFKILCSINQAPEKMLQNLLYFWNQKTKIVFIFQSYTLYFLIVTIEALIYDMTYLCLQIQNSSN